MNTDAPWPDLDEAERRVLGIQTKLHQWATDDPHRRFDDLFNLVADPAFLVVAWDRVRGNRGARSAGVDGVAPRSIVFGVEGFLAGLRDDLKARRFEPLPVREWMIPKPGSAKRRRLGIPTARDRTVQAALKLVLEPIFEADFKPVSYGFRPGRRAHDAIAEIHQFTSRGYEWVLEGDITACFDAPSHCPLRCWCVVKEAGFGPIHLDSQAFSASRADVDGFELAALDTLQHGLAGHAEDVSGFQHRHEAGRRVVDEAGAQRVGHADAPRRAGGELFAGDEAVVDPAMNGGGSDAEDLGCLDHGDQLAVGCLSGWLIARDLPVPSIAVEANVALKTVYLVFENKAGLLRAVWEARLGGEEEAIPVLERSWFREVTAEPDPEQKLRRVAAQSRRVKTSSGALLEVIRTAAVTDPEIAILWSDIEAKLLSVQRAIVEQLDETDSLAPGLTTRHATDVLWTLNHPTVWHLLVRGRRWSPTRYETWLHDAFCLHLLGRRSRHPTTPLDAPAP